MSDEKYKYKVRKGFAFRQATPDEKKAGEVVELTEAQAAGFSDVLIPINAPRTMREAVMAKPEKTPFEEAVLAEGGLLPDDEEGNELDELTVTELKKLPEWDLLPDPKPAKKADIIAAILEVRE